MLGIGACVVSVESVLAQYYMEDFNKSLEWGGRVLGIGSIVYTASTLIAGPIGMRFPILQSLYLVLGQFGMGAMLLFLGPVIPCPNTIQIMVSASAFCLIMVCGSALGYASLACTADKLSQTAAADAAMGIALNVWNMAYNLGAMLGPIIALNLRKISLLEDFKTIFAMGCPFFFVSSIVLIIHRSKKPALIELCRRLNFHNYI
jgi:MFS family permease